MRPSSMESLDHQQLIAFSFYHLMCAWERMCIIYFYDNGFSEDSKGYNRPDLGTTFLLGMCISDISSLMQQNSIYVWEIE